MTTLIDVSGTTQSLSSQPLPLRKLGFGLRYNRAYYYGFLLALLFCWSPSNALAYITPAFVTVYYLLATRSGVVFRNLILVGSLWLLWIMLHAPFVGNFAWGSALLSMLTFSAFIPVVVIPTRFLSGQWLMPRFERWIRITVLLQASLGIVQAFYGFYQNGSFDVGNGDYVEGTIHPWLAPEGSFSNPMFATNMTFLILFLIPKLLTQRKNVFVILLGLFSLVLASVMHVLLFLGVAIGIVFFLYAPAILGRRSGWLLVGLTIMAMIVALNLLSANFSQVRRVAGLATGGSPRGEMLSALTSQVMSEYPYMSLFGLGPGQFSSRASLIGTGYYYGTVDAPRTFPLVPQQFSEPFERYALPVWSKMFGWGGYWGSTYQPFFSWLTLLTEFGIFACLLLLLLVAYLLLHIRHRARNYRTQASAIALSIGILFTFFLGFQENYWEVPQAIFPGLLILKVMYAQFQEMTTRHYDLAKLNSATRSQGTYTDQVAGGHVPS
jgi:hypothetical protein